jgi:hypothetical protein
LGILLFFGITWYSFKALPKRRKEYLNYKRMRTNGHGRPAQK